MGGYRDVDAGQGALLLGKLLLILHEEILPRARAIGVLISSITLWITPGPWITPPWFKDGGWRQFRGAIDGNFWGECRDRPFYYHRNYCGLRPPSAVTAARFWWPNAAPHLRFGRFPLQNWIPGI